MGHSRTGSESGQGVAGTAGTPTCHWLVRSTGDNLGLRLASEWGAAGPSPDPFDPILPQAEATSGAELQGSQLVSDNHLDGVPCAALMAPQPLVHDLSEVVLICVHDKDRSCFQK